MFNNIKTAEQLATEKAQADFEVAINAWKQQRQEAVDNIVVTLNGKEFQGDELSQTRLSRAIVALPDDVSTTPWVAKDNTVVMLNKLELKDLLKQAGNAQNLLWNDGRPTG